MNKREVSKEVEKLGHVVLSNATRRNNDQINA